LIAELQASDIPDDLLRQSRHLHVASYFLQTKLQPGLTALFDRAHSLGLTTSLDTNYDPSEEWIGFDTLLSAVDIFFPNRTEALSITRASDVESAARQLATKSRLIVIKLGAEGAALQTDDKTFFVPSLPVKLIDTVGAGDSFDAGFLYGYLAGWDLEKALQLGVVCGSLSTQASGGTAAQPTLNEALVFMK
jgi:sugar/nucleoside kinase (ribokinase family)